MVKRHMLSTYLVSFGSVRCVYLMTLEAVVASQPYKHKGPRACLNEH